MNVEETIKTSVKMPLETRTLIHLTLVHNKIYEVINNALKPFEISVQQFNVLRILRGHKGKPSNLCYINERMVSKMSNTTRLVDKLISKGYVNRFVCESNRRKVEILITEEGFEVLSKIDKVVADAEGIVVQNFSKAELEQLNLLLDKF